MPALRFFALITLAFVLPGGAFLWHQQLALMEREAARVLRGPELTLAVGAGARWRVDFAANTVDQAWMHCQRQPRLSVVLPVTPAGSERPKLRARARYLAEGALPAAPAFIGAATLDEAREVEPGPDGVVQYGPLWLSYLQPLEIELELVAGPSTPGVVGFGPLRPMLAGEASADYLFARSIDRSIYVAFVCLGVLGVALFLLAERRRGFVAPDADALGRGRGAPASAST